MTKSAYETSDNVSKQKTAYETSDNVTKQKTAYKTSDNVTKQKTAYKTSDNVTKQKNSTPDFYKSNTLRKSMNFQSNFVTSFMPFLIIHILHNRDNREILMCTIYTVLPASQCL